MLRRTYQHAAPAPSQQSRRQSHVTPSITVRTHCVSSSAALGVVSACVAAQTVPARPAVAHTALPALNAARFEDECTLFVEEFRIRGNEAGPDQRANVITIANLLQEVGGNHGVAMWGRASSGFAAMPGMDHLIFVATRMQIRMETYPSWGDLVRLETYFQEDGRLSSRRDWRLVNAVTGQYLGAATSTWVTINSETRKLAKIPQEVKQRFTRLAPIPPRHVLPQTDTRRKLPDFSWPPKLTAPSQLGRRSDMDPNGHINNVAYLAWALEVIPEHIYQEYTLTEVEMDFKAECTAGDQIECFGMPLTDCANSNGSTQQFLHLLQKGGSDVEVWRARTTWTPHVAAAAAAAAVAAAERAVASEICPNGSHVSNGKVRPCSSSQSNSDNRSAPVHPSGSSCLLSSDKISASCSQIDCSNASSSNHNKDTTVQADPWSTTVALNSALSKLQADGGSQVAEHEPNLPTSPAVDARRKGWFHWW